MAKKQARLILVLKIGVAVIEERIERHIRTYGEHGNHRNHLRDMRIAILDAENYIKQSMKLVTDK